jgi:hypothetical protein
VAIAAPQEGRMSTERRDEERAEGGEPIFPPTDPVLSPAGESLVGGFAQTSMDEVRVAHSTIDRRPGDEALADAIRRELREDALTTQLEISVDVRAGVAFLRGHVDDLEDTDNVAEVASRVPGVRQVVDQLSFRER